MKRNKQKSPKRGRNNNKNDVVIFQNILERGENNAKTCNQLMPILGYNNMYSVRKEIKRSRLAGQVVLSSHKGYYLASSSDEILRYIDGMKSRINSIEDSIASARQELKELNITEY